MSSSTTRATAVLAAADTGTAPSAIARNLGVGYSTVTRIL
ncbi:helix-turn-helix domain-containing protein, partial [Mycolicibacterium insubricum]